MSLNDISPIAKDCKGDRLSVDGVASNNVVGIDESCTALESYVVLPPNVCFVGDANCKSCKTSGADSIDVSTSDVGLKLSDIFSVAIVVVNFGVGDVNGLKETSPAEGKID